MNNDSTLVRHVLECISRIEEDASEGRDAFFASRRIQDALVRNLQIMSLVYGACARHPGKKQPNRSDAGPPASRRAGVGVRGRSPCAAVC